MIFVWYFSDLKYGNSVHNFALATITKPPEIDELIGMLKRKLAIISTSFQRADSESMSSNSDNLSQRSPDPARREIIDAMKATLQKGSMTSRNPDVISPSPSLETPRKEPLPRIENGYPKLSTFDEIVEMHSNDPARERELKGQHALDVAAKRSAAVTPPVGGSGEFGDDNKRKERKGKAKNKTKVAPVED